MIVQRLARVMDVHSGLHGAVYGQEAASAVRPPFWSAVVECARRGSRSLAWEPHRARPELRSFHVQGKKASAARKAAVCDSDHALAGCGLCIGQTLGTLSMNDPLVVHMHVRVIPTDKERELEPRRTSNSRASHRVRGACAIHRSALCCTSRRNRCLLFSFLSLSVSRSRSLSLLSLSLSQSCALSGRPVHLALSFPSFSFSHERVWSPRRCLQTRQTNSFLLSLHAPPHHAFHFYRRARHHRRRVLRRGRMPP